MVWKRLFLRQILLLLKRNFGEFTDANKGRSSLLCYPSYCVAAIWKRILKVFSNTSMVMWMRYGHVMFLSSLLSHIFQDFYMGISLSVITSKHNHASFWRLDR